MLEMMILTAAVLGLVFMAYRVGRIDGWANCQRAASEAFGPAGAECYQLGYDRGHEDGWLEGCRFSRPHVGGPARKPDAWEQRRKYDA